MERAGAAARSNIIVKFILKKGLQNAQQKQEQEEEEEEVLEEALSFEILKGLLVDHVALAVLKLLLLGEQAKYERGNGGRE